MACTLNVFNVTPSASQVFGGEVTGDKSTFAPYPNDGVFRNPSYIDLWEVEKRMDLNIWTQWHNQYWQLALASSAIYLIVIFGIKFYMKSRPAYNFRKSLLLWNLCLALFSVVGFWRTGAGLFFDLRQSDGVHNSICKANSATIFWGMLFGFSKILELGDTIFVVLHKKPLIFLHYYHHVSVLCYVWITSAATNSSSPWFGVMNYGVHSLMYLYYALRAAQVKVPKPFAMAVTLLQLLQMVLGIGVNSYIVYVIHGGRECRTKIEDVYYAFILYGSYFVLFAKFFLEAYVQQKKHNKLDKKL